MKFTIVLFFTLAACALPIRLAAAQDNNRFVQIVLFHAVDAKAPAGHQDRLRSLGRYAEAFLEREMRRWDRPIKRTQIFARDKEGKIRVTVTSGKLASGGRDALPEIRTRALRSAGQQLRIPPGKPVVWWIFYDYTSVKGFRGGADGSGGMAINAYPPGEGTFDPTHYLAAPEFAAANVKGAVHEFGHALGLPHIGPRPGLKLGNSLMGPVNRAFWGRTNTKDTRVHLSEVSAAMLESHPIFQPKATAEPILPAKVQLQDLKAIETDGQIVVKGKLSAGRPALTAVILDSERGRFGDYWARPYTAPINADTGEFNIRVTEPFTSGTLFLSFSFAHGVTTSDGDKQFQRGSDIQFRYRGKPGARNFQPAE